MKVKVKEAPPFITIIWGGLVALLVGFYFYSIHTGQAGRLLASVHHLGLLGVVAGIALMALFSIIPVPSEFVSILLMQVYGVWGGILYSWLGAIVGAMATLYMARALARPLAMRFAGKYVRWIKPWLERRGTAGLLLVRLLPMVPYHVVNYAAGILDVPLLPFAWTSALGLIPFQAALASVYSGYQYGSWLMYILGGGFLVLLVVLGWVFRRKLLEIPENS